MTALHNGGSGRIRPAAPAVVLVAGALLATVVVAVPAAPTTAAGGRPPKAASIGTYAVGRVEEDFVDSSRATKAHADFPGSPAARSMSGVAGQSPDYFSGISTPLPAEHGDANGTLLYPAGADSFAHASPPKFFLTLFGGVHTAPYRGGPDAHPTAVAHVTLDFFDRYLKNDQGALERLRRDADQPGVATLQEQSR